MAYVIGVDVGATFTDAVSRRRRGHRARGEVALDAAGLLARRAGTCSGARGTARDGHSRRMLARHPPHRPRHHVVAERVGHGQRACRRLPHHQGPPRLDLHHERRGPLPRPFAARAATRARPVQTARAAPEAARPGGHRADRPRRERGRRLSTRTLAREAIRALLADGVVRDRGVAAVVVPATRCRTAAARAGSARPTPTCLSPCRLEVSPRILEFAGNATTIMSTQIGPGLRDYLSSLGSRGCANASWPVRCS